MCLIPWSIPPCATQLAAYLFNPSGYLCQFVPLPILVSVLPFPSQIPPSQSPSLSIKPLLEREKKTYVPASPEDVLTTFRSIPEWIEITYPPVPFFLIRFRFVSGKN